MHYRQRSTEQRGGRKRERGGEESWKAGEEEERTKNEDQQGMSGCGRGVECKRKERK